MARAIDYDATRRPPQNEARKELDQLIESLHDQGVLRLLNDLVSAAPQVSELLLKGLNQEEAQNAVQNVSLLAMALGRIPPERFVLLTRGVTAALEAMQKRAQEGEHKRAPGVVGFYRLLHDEQLWGALRPVLHGAGAFSDCLHEPPAKPTTKRDRKGDSAPDSGAS